MYLTKEEQIESRHHQLNFRYINFIKNQRTFEGIKIQHYAILEKIGQGAFAQIYRGVDENDNKQVAVKVLNLRTIEAQKNFNLKKIRRRLADEESKIMMKFNHTNILKCYQCFQNKDFKIMMLQFCNSGSLQDKIDEQGSIPQNQAVSILKQIINGVGVFHHEKIIHRDMKPDNILIHNGVYKIADFGFSKVLNIQNQQEIIQNTSLGTIVTMAPQVLNGDRYGLKADIWSVGVIFFYMLFGECPFKSDTAIKMVAEIANTRLLTEEMYKGVRPSENAKRFLREVLVVDIQKRLGWKQLYNHELLKAQNSRLQGNFQRQIELSSPNKQLQRLECHFEAQNISHSNLFIKDEKTFDEGDTKVFDTSNEQQLIEAYIMNNEKKQDDHQKQISLDQVIKSVPYRINAQKQNQHVSSSKIKFQLSKYLDEAQNKKTNHLEQQQQGQEQVEVIKHQKEGLQNQYNLDTDRGQDPKPVVSHTWDADMQRISQISAKQQTPDGIYTGYKKLTPQQKLRLQQTINRSQAQAYKWAQRIYIQCKKTQVIYYKILKPIEQLKLLDLTKRSNIQFMYLVSTRCLNNMSPINESYNKMKSSKIIQELNDKVKKLYEKVTNIWMKYSKLLTEKENEKVSIIVDWIFKKVQNQKITTKNKYLTGIENIHDYKEQQNMKRQQEIDVLDYNKSEQISYTIGYIEAVLNQLKTSPTSTAVVKHLEHYKDICLIDFQDLRMRTFDQYLSLVLM